MDLYTLSGLAGAAGYITSFVLLQLGVLDGNGVRYSVANVVAACLMLVSIIDQFHLGVALIQIIWIVFGVWGLTRRYLRDRSLAPVLVVDEARTNVNQVANSDAAHRGSGAPGRVVRRSAGSTSPFRAASVSVAAPARVRATSTNSVDRLPTLGICADVLPQYRKPAKHA